MSDTRPCYAPTGDGWGEYVTRNGNKAQVIISGIKGLYPVVGHVLLGETWQVCSWTLNGSCIDKEIGCNDIVGPWVDPPVITKPGEYLTECGKVVLITPSNKPDMWFGTYLMGNVEYQARFNCNGSMRSSTSLRKIQIIKKRIHD